MGTAQAVATPSARRGAIVMMLAAALAWGVWWAPIHALEAAGLPGLWASFTMNVCALPVLAAMAFLRGDGARLPLRAVLGAVLIGAAVTFYGGALVFTDVVRAVLLFYLAPVWSTVIECVFLGRRWSLRSAAAIALSLIGALTIFRGEIALSAWSPGDALALASGVCWSIGSALVFVAPAPSRPLAAACGLAAVVFGGLLIAFGGPLAGPIPDMADALTATPLAFAAGALYLAPILFATMWGANRLAPALFSFLLTAEIVSGVLSSALFLDEPFGAFEAVGAALVVSGALIEAFSSGTASPGGAPEEGRDDAPSD